MSTPEYPEADQGRCRSCGFLSKHGTRTAGIPSPRFYEVEHSERIEGSFFTHTPAAHMGTESEPMCFRQKINLMEIEEQQGRAKLLEAVNADRRCDSWYPYTPGLGPIEHYEEYQVQELERHRRDLQVKLSEMELAVQRHGAEVTEKNAIILKEHAEIAEASKQLVGELKDVAVRSDRTSRRATWLVVLLAIAQVIVGLMVYFHESYTDRLLKSIFGPLK